MTVIWQYFLLETLKCTAKPYTSTPIPMRGIHTGGQTYLVRDQSIFWINYTEQVCIVCGLYPTLFGSHHPHHSSPDFSIQAAIKAEDKS